MLKIKCVTKDGVELPKYESLGASGMDLRAYSYSMSDNLKVDISLKDDKDYILPAHFRALIKTGLFVEIPEGYEIQIRPRSGLALKNGVTVLNTPGTIDADYRGEIGVILINTSNKDFAIRKGDRIAQAVVQKVEKAELIKVNQLSDTIRGNGGYNSTGQK